MNLQREKANGGRGEQGGADVGVWASLSGMIWFHFEEKEEQREAEEL